MENKFIDQIFNILLFSTIELLKILLWFDHKMSYQKEMNYLDDMRTNINNCYNYNIPSIRSYNKKAN